MTIQVKNFQFRETFPLKIVNPSSAGDFAICSLAGELEIESESWRLGICSVAV